LRTAAYRLRIRNIANFAQYQLHTAVGSLNGHVIKTRQLLLEEAVRDALPAMVDFAQPLLHLPEAGHWLPNPLRHWPALLQEQLPMRIGTVHGDLNAGNVLVDVDAKSTFIIDCAHAHRDHALYDLVRLESEVVLHMAAWYFYRLGLPPTKIYELYSWLDEVTRREPDAPGVFALPQPLLQTTPDLQAIFVALTTIRNAARPYLARPNQWREYYAALALTLLGSLTFASLERATAGTRGQSPKRSPFGARPRSLRCWSNQRVFRTSLGSRCILMTKQRAKTTLNQRCILIIVICTIASFSAGMDRSRFRAMLSLAARSIRLTFMVR
jgi:hypothetical protein